MMIRYITQVFYCALLCMVSIHYSYGQPQGDGVNGVFNLIPVDDRKHHPCFNNVKLSGNYDDNNNGKNVLLLNIDCPENTDFYIDLPIPIGCGCDQWSINFGGDNFLVYPANDSPTPVNWLNSSNLRHGKYRFNLPVNQNTIYERTIDVRIHCGTVDFMWISKEFYIQVVSNGGTYEVYEGSDGNGYGELEELDFPDVCCCEKKCPTSKICVERSTSTVSSVGNNNTMISLAFSAGGKNFGFEGTVPFPVSFDGTSPSNTFVNNISDEISTQNCLPDPDLGNCIKVCARSVWKIAKYTNYIANCDEVDQILGTVKKIIPKSVGIDLINCGFQFPVNNNSCPQLIAKPKKKFNFRYLNECTGNAGVEIISGSQELFFEWAGPDGFKSNQMDITNVPFGQYTLTVSDNCCNVVTEIIYLCDEIIATPWTKDNNGKWCRTVDCKGGPALRNSCGGTYTECVTPDRIEDTFDQNQKKCVKEYYLNNELLGTTSVDATYETEWDDFFERCETTYYCDGDEVHTEEYDPEDSAWTYDYWSEECQLTVNCMGEEISMSI